MTAVRSVTEVTCSTPDCGYYRIIRIADRDTALRALLDTGEGWEVVGPLRDPSRAYCPNCHADRRREARAELARVRVVSADYGSNYPDDAARWASDHARQPDDEPGDSDPTPLTPAERQRAQADQAMARQAYEAEMYRRYGVDDPWREEFLVVQP